MTALLTPALPAQDETDPLKIVHQHLDAIGGEKALKSVNTIMRKGKLSLGPQGPEIPFDIYTKRPNRTRQELEFQGNQIILATNGTMAWQLNPLAGATEPAEMPPAQAKSFMRGAFVDGIYFENMEKRGVKLRYVAEVEEDGRHFQHLLVTFGDGHEQHRFYDKQSGLLTKIKQTQPSQNGEQEVTTTFREWRSYKGLKFPLKMETSAGQTMVFEETEVNVPLEDSLFEIPVP